MKRGVITSISLRNGFGGKFVTLAMGKCYICSNSVLTLILKSTVGPVRL